MTLTFVNSATFRILLSKIRAGEIKGYMAAIFLADAEVLKERDEKGRMLLHHAALSNREEIISDLLARGASKDAVDNDGFTAYRLIERKKFDKAKKLLAPEKMIAIAEITPVAVEDGQPVQKREPKTLRVPASTVTSFQGKPAIA